MLTLFLTPLLLCPAARAGTWQFSCTGSGSGTFNESSTFYGTPESSSYPLTWTPPASSTGTSFQIPSFGYTVNPPGELSSASTNTKETQTVSIQAVITITWVHGTGQSDANDPAPPSVMLIESSSAQWVAEYEDGTPGMNYGSGGASDGLAPADPAVPSYYGGVQSGGISTSANDANVSVPPPHYITVAVNNDVVTLNRTFSASASAALPNDGSQGAMNVGCAFGGYTVQIHAQPYNFHKTTSADNGDGTLSFTYDWYSTTGYKSDLTTCYTHERVTYPGSSNPYVAPAPFNQSVTNPTVLPSSDSSSNSMATAVGSDTHYVWASTGPYTTTVTVTAAQRYEFNDTATHQQNVLTPGPDSTASIVRTITNSRSGYPAGNWWYSITKQGLTAWLKVQ